MWILELKFNGTTTEYHLVGGCEYSVGRKDCDIVIKGADSSVSRLHLRLIINSVPAGELQSASYLPEVFVSDESKHGTFINGSRLVKEDARRKFEQGDLIICGRQAEIQLTYVPIVVCPSEHLSEIQFKQLQGAVCRIGGLFVEEPLSQKEVQHQGVSPIMFVFATNQVEGEPRALLAMMNRYVLVNSTFLDDVFTFFRDGAHLPLSLIPAPGHFEAMRNPLLADAPYFRPEPAIFQPFEFKTHPLVDPSSTFRGINFMCLNEQVYEKYAPIVRLGGARCDFVPAESILDWSRTRRTLRHHTSGAGNSPSPNRRRGGAAPEISQSDKVMEDAFQLRGLIGGPHVHGLNLIVLMPGLQFTILVDRLTTTDNGDSPGKTSSGSNPADATAAADGHVRGPSATGESGAEAASPSSGYHPNTTEIDPETEAYLALWKDDKMLMHEENLHIAIYTSDSASQIQPNSPGVLSKSAMQVDGPDSDCDSEATQENLVHEDQERMIQQQIQQHTQSQFLSARAGSSSAPLNSPPRARSPQRGLVVAHAAQQVFASRSPPSANTTAAAEQQKRAQSPLSRQVSSFSSKPASVSGSVATGGAAASLDLYSKWHSYQKMSSQNSSLAGGAESGLKARGLQSVSGSSATRSILSPARGRSPVANSPGASGRVQSPVNRVHANAPLLAPAVIRNPKSNPFKKSTVEEKVVVLCNTFLTSSLLTMGPKVETICSGSVKANYLTAGNRLFLKTSLQRISSFTATLDDTLGETAASHNTSRGAPTELVQNFDVENQRVLQEVRARCETLSNAIQATSETVTGSSIPLSRGKKMDVEELLERQQLQTEAQRIASLAPPGSRGNSPARSAGRRVDSPAAQQQRGPFRAGSPGVLQHSPSLYTNSPVRGGSGGVSTPMSRARSPVRGGLSRALVLSPARNGPAPPAFH